jgi:hypothetical protein
VAPDVLVATGNSRTSRRFGAGRLFTVRAGERTAEAAALSYVDSPIPEPRAAIRFEWSAMDTWFEENEEVYVHPRDRKVRVDVLTSSRQVRVEVAGVTVAESHQPRLLFETGLPTRYYLPTTDLRLDLLERTDTSTHCP